MKTCFCILAFLSAFAVKAQNPTWADDVACILYSHCTSCHNPKGAGPFSLLTYSDAKNNALMISYAVGNGSMPPWPPDRNYRSFAHERVLSEQEKLTILNWVKQGKVAGDTLSAPAAPVYNSNLLISNPDLKLRIPTYTVPAITHDLYRCFVVSTQNIQQKFITGMEIIPGNRNIVHHVQIFYDTTGTCQSLDDADNDPGYTSAGGVGTSAAVLLGTWVPGSSPIFVPAGMGKRLPATAKIVIQIHYPDFASGQTDSTKVNLLYTSAVVRNISDAPVLNHSTSIVNGPLFIPANTVKTFIEQFTVPINATLLSVGPHGHLICKSMKAFGITLAGDTIKLIDIPQWDFHWQGFYDFRKPVRIPFGTKLIGIATYDNTVDNPHNPHSPPQDIQVGESTDDEMMLFYFSYLTYQNGDENIIVDTASHSAHHLDCSFDDKSTGISSQSSARFRLYPNPVSHILHIESGAQQNFEFVLMDVCGRVVQRESGSSEIDISAHKQGLYLVKIEYGDTYYCEYIYIE